MEKAFSSIYRYTKDDFPNWENSILVEKKTEIQNVPIHWHDHYEIEYIVSGSGRQILNGAEYPIAAGMLHFLTPTGFHELMLDSDKLEIIKFNFGENDVEPFILSTMIGIYGDTVISFSEKEQNILYGLFVMSVEHTKNFKDSVYYSQMVKKLLECVLLNMIEKMGKTERSLENVSVGNIQKVLIYIHQHFKESLELKTVADIVHYSPQYLSKLFHRVLGTTFKKYITNLRLNYASELLLNSHMEISQICSEAGFGTRQNFTKEFKKFYGCSPLEYRQNNKKQTKTLVT